MFGFLSGAGCGDDYRRVYAVNCQRQWAQLGRLSAIFHGYEAVFLRCLAIDLGVVARPAADSPKCCQLRSRCDGQAFNHELDDFCAAFTLLLASIKWQDDVADRRSVLGRTALKVYQRRIQSAYRYFAEIDAGFESHIRSILRRHNEVENRRVEEVALAEFQRATSQGFAYVFRLFAESVLKRTDVAQQMESMGGDLGAAIIAFDCAVDWRSDARSGDFNPLRSAAAANDSLRRAELHLASMGWTLWQLAPHAELSLTIVRANLERVARRRRQLLASKPDSRLQPWREKAKLGRAWNFATMQAVYRRGDCDCFCPGEACDADCCTGCASCPCELCCCDCYSQKTERPNKLPPSGKVTGNYVGKEGVVTAPLKPSGMVVIDGREMPAISEDGLLIEVGATVSVVAQNAFGIVVRSQAGNQLASQ